jgi:CBS domain containing-hemolysin-like protein
MGMKGRTIALFRAIAIGVALSFAGVEPCLAASGEFADKAATALAIFIIVVLPIAGIAVFWLVHVLPEKVAEKRQHPQKDAIHVLCLLSLVFGGLLWPLAWLWAYSKPVMYKLAYGRDKHDEHYEGLEKTATIGAPELPVQVELGRLRRELEEVEKRGELPDAMKGIRKRLAAIESRIAGEGEG